MTILTGESLILTDPNDGAKSATLHFVDGEFHIDVTSAVPRILIKKGGDRVVIEADRVRVDGGARVEVSATSVVRINAGGSGVTYQPAFWTHYYPDYSLGYERPAGEHPDTGGTTSNFGTSSADDVLLAEYAARNPGYTP